MPLDSIAVLSLLDRATDANGAIVPGAKLYFYEAGTTTPLTVYSDPDLTLSLGAVVTCDAGGYPTSDGNAQCSIYTGTDSYKVEVKTSTGTTVLTRDNIRGASVIPDTTSTAIPETPLVSRTSTYTILTTDQGKLINADPTAGSFAVTLPNAITAGDGWRVGVRHAGTTNVVTVRSTGGQSIAMAGQSDATSAALTGRGHTRWFVSDGAGWTVDSEVPPLMGGPLPFLKVSDRLTAPPTSPIGGARYIVSGTPTGVWLTLGFQENDVAESDGNGSWLRYQPADGWLAYVADENLVTQYQDTDWIDFTNVTAPDTSSLQVASFSHELGTNTNGGTAATGAWTASVINTTRTNTITNCTLASNQIALPYGKYFFSISKSFYGTDETQIRLACGLGNKVSPTVYVPRYTSGTGPADIIVGSEVSLSGYIDITTLTGEVVEVQYYAKDGGADSRALGVPRNVGAEPEVYGTFTFVKLEAMQGPQGEDGPQGPGGLDAAYPYLWSTSTSGDPGTGYLRANNSTLSSATQIGISETTGDLASIAAVMATWDDSTSSIKARIKITKEGATNNFVEFLITGTGSDQGAYWTFPVSYVASGGTLVNNDELAVIVIEKGDLGDPGTTVPDPSGLSTRTAPLLSTESVLVYDGALKLGAPAVVTPWLTPERHSAVGDGAANDTAAMAAAIVQASLGIGGGVILCTGKYLLDSITLPRNVWLVGPGQRPCQPLSGVSIYDYPGQLRLKSGATITMGQSAGLKNLAIVRDGLAPLPPTTSAEAATLVGTFGGTAITGTGTYYQVEGCLIAGFAQASSCTATSSQGGSDFRDVHIDCTAGLLQTGGGFNSSWHRVVCWPYLTAAVAASGSAGLHRSGSAFKLVDGGGVGNDWTCLFDTFAYGYATAYDLVNCSGIDLIAPKADYGAGYTGTEVGIKITGSSLGRIGISMPKIITIPTSIQVNLTGSTSAAHVRIALADLVPNTVGLDLVSGSVTMQGGTITNGPKGVNVGAAAEDFIADGLIMDTLTDGIVYNASWAGYSRVTGQVFRSVTTEFTIPDAVLDQIQLLGVDAGVAPYGNTLSNLTIYDTNAQLLLRQASGTANEKIWDLIATSGALQRRASTDAGTFTAFETVSRSGGTPTLIAWTVPTRTDQIELGHTSDTTFVRSSAGRATIEGNEIMMYGSVGPAWTSYTPTIGGITGTGTGRYARNGKTLHFSVQITVTTGGVTAPTFTLPVQAANDIRYIVSGKNASAGTQWSTLIDPNATSATLVRYDGAAPTSNGDVLVVTGTYQTV